MSVIIVGMGYVGKHIAKLFMSLDPVLYDKKYGESYPKDVFDVAIVAVPTPMNIDGSCDISMVEDVIKNIKADLFIIKSTVPPSTTNRLIEKHKKNIVFSPEYVGSSSVEPALDDAKSQPFVIFGGRPECTQKAVDLWTKVRNANLKTMQCSAVEAECIKYTENLFIANKVVFLNEIYEACKHFKVDYNIVREGFLLDPRMSRYFTFVYKSDRGYGGHCLIKDMEAFIKSCEKVGYNPEFLKDIKKNNERMKTYNE